MTSRPLHRVAGALLAGVVSGAMLPASTAPAATTTASRHLTADAVYDPQALRALAERGDKRAAFLLGSRFASGRSGVRDDSEAVRWFRQAAEGGLAEAQYNLGIMYAGGRGVPRDYAAAATWYEKAAQQGLSEAQFNLGTLYGLGRGVPRDEAAAAKWLELAAKKGLPQAQYNLGALFEHGRGVRLDGYQALAWYQKAADQGFEPARERHAALSRKLALQPKSTASPQTPPASVADAAPAAAAPPVALPGDVQAARAWVAGLDPGHYTLQLASFNEPADAMRFLSGLDSSGGAGIYSAVKRGKQWYAVVYGDFESFEQARAAIASLPEAIRSSKPWVRKVALVHEEMD